MDLFFIPVIATAVLFVIFLVLNLLQKQETAIKSKPSETKKEETKPAPQQANKTSEIKVELCSRPNFSDMLTEKKEHNEKQIKRVVDTSRLKILKASEGIEAKPDLYNKKSNSKTNKLAKEIQDLSPEMKTVLFGNVLDQK